MGKAHQNQKKTAQPKSETNELATWKKINTRKQTPPVQSSTPTPKSSSAFNPRLSDPF
jgi:hypothetical protein